jgi:hypothetical protein
MVVNYRQHEAMELDDAIEEGFGDQSGNVGVAQRDEMSMLGEPINHDQDDTLAMDVRKAFDEIKRNV